MTRASRFLVFLSVGFFSVSSSAQHHAQKATDGQLFLSYYTKKVVPSCALDEAHDTVSAINELVRVLPGVRRVDPLLLNVDDWQLVHFDPAVTNAETLRSAIEEATKKVASPGFKRSAVVRTAKPAADVCALDRGLLKVTGGVPPAIRLLATTVAPVSKLPHDPLYRRQRAVHELIHLPVAWSAQTGSKDVAVAVIDSGIAKTNPGLCDVVDEANGVDTVAVNAADRTLRDQIGHGTAVAGIIGEHGDDRGGVGVNWSVRLIPFRIVGPDGGGTLGNALTAFDSVLAKVIAGVPIRVVVCAWKNASEATPEFLALEEQAIRDLGLHDVTVVCAAGNSRADSDALIPRVFPASFRLPNIISVTSSDIEGERAVFANHSKTLVDVAAPGVDVVTTGIYSHVVASGTSISAAYVAGAVALMIANEPKKTLSPARVKEKIERAVKKFTAGTMYPKHDWKDDVAFGGILDFERLLQ